MNKTRTAVVSALAILFAATSLHAQTGCTDSPENPTAVLGLVGACGWLVASSRRRIGELGPVYRASAVSKTNGPLRRSLKVVRVNGRDD